MINELCPACDLPINPDTAVWSKKLQKFCCSEDCKANAEPGHVSSGKCQVVGKTHRTRRDYYGKESLADAQAHLAGAPSTGEWGPQKT
jgi:hypothetical protein